MLLLRTVIACLSLWTGASRWLPAVEARSYSNGLIFYDLRSSTPYLPPTVSVSRGRNLASVKYSEKGSIWSTFGQPCECQGLKCGCCAGLKVDQFRFNQKMCANVTFVPQLEEAQLEVFLNERASAKYGISVRDPSPFCIPVMMGLPMAMCVQLTNVGLAGNNLNMCMDFVVRLASTDLFEMHFQCMRMGLDGVMYVDKNGQPVLPSSVDNDDDEPAEQIEYEEEDDTEQHYTDAETETADYAAAPLYDYAAEQAADTQADKLLVVVPEPSSHEQPAAQAVSVMKLPPELEPEQDEEVEEEEEEIEPVTETELDIVAAYAPQPIPIESEMLMATDHKLVEESATATGTETETGTGTGTLDANDVDNDKLADNATAADNDSDNGDVYSESDLKQNEVIETITNSITAAPQSIDTTTTAAEAATVGPTATAATSARPNTDDIHNYTNNEQLVDEDTASAELNATNAKVEGDATEAAATTSAYAEAATEAVTDILMAEIENVNDNEVNVDDDNEDGGKETVAYGAEDEQKVEAYAEPMAEKEQQEEEEQVTETEIEADTEADAVAENNNEDGDDDDNDEDEDDNDEEENNNELETDAEIDENAGNDEDEDANENDVDNSNESVTSQADSVLAAATATATAAAAAAVNNSTNNDSDKSRQPVDGHVNSGAPEPTEPLAAPAKQSESELEEAVQQPQPQPQPPALAGYQRRLRQRLYGV